MEKERDFILNHSFYEAEKKLSKTIIKLDINRERRLLIMQSQEFVRKCIRERR